MFALWDVYKCIHFQNMQYLYQYTMYYRISILCKSFSTINIELFTSKFEYLR